VAEGIPVKENFPFDLKAVAGAIPVLSLLRSDLAEGILFPYRVILSVASKATNCEII